MSHQLTSEGYQLKCVCGEEFGSIKEGVDHIEEVDSNE